MDLFGWCFLAVGYKEKKEEFLCENRLRKCGREKVIGFDSFGGSWHGKTPRDPSFGSLETCTLSLEIKDTPYSSVLPLEEASSVDASLLAKIFLHWPTDEFETSLAAIACIPFLLIFMSTVQCACSLVPRGLEGSSELSILDFLDAYNLFIKQTFLVKAFLSKSHVLIFLGDSLSTHLLAAPAQLNIETCPMYPMISGPHWTRREVIKFSDSYKAPPEETIEDKGLAGEVSASTKKKGRTVTITAEDMQKRKNDVNARTTLFKKSKFPNVQGVSTASAQVSIDSTDVAAASISYDTVGAFIATQPNGSQIKYEDISQIDDDDIKEMDIKWNLALLRMRADRWVILLESAYHQGVKIEGRESYKKDPKVEELAPKAMIAIDEEVLTKYALMAKSSSSLDNEVYDDSFCSKSCRKKTENLNTKISKLNEELSDRETDLYTYKRGLSQVEARLVEFKENEIKFCEKIRVLERDIELNDNKIEYLRNKLEEMGLPEFVDDTVTNYTRPTPSIDVSKSVSMELEERWKRNNPSFLEQRGSSGNVVSKPMIKFMKEYGYPNSTKVNNTENARKPTVKYAEMYRNTSQSLRVRGNQRNWNNQKSQQLRKDFMMQNKACYNCGRGNITGKGSIKTGKLEFENVYFMEELKYNLFSVSQICDNKNSVLFTNTECLVLRKDFKLVDDKHVLLRTPRQQNMYTLDLKNVDPYTNLTCLIAKALVDESMLWHRRLGHLNFKAMNKLVRSNLVKGKFDAKGDEGYFIGYSLSSKAFKDDAIPNNNAPQKEQDEVNRDKEVPESSGNSNPTSITKFSSNDSLELASSSTVETEVPTVSTPVRTGSLYVPLKQGKTSGQGHTQEEGIDYEEVFALVTRIEAIRLFLAYASYMGFTVYQMDVKSDFLYETINEEVYVMQPPNFQDLEFPHKVYKVEKPMYGLHQAPRAWYGTLSNYLMDNGFQRGTIDHTLFIRKHKGEFLLVQLYVDDIIFGSSNPKLCRKFEALMNDKFQMSDVGELNFFLSLQVLQKKDGIFLS
nr:putative ribonuclease H-like domain-containing protein [Tanacetum cinerariifolium]